MDDGPEWFAPKRHGYGSGMPIARQGWALLIGFLLVTIGSSLLFAERPLALLSIVVPLTAMFLFIAARTTPGGWRWRSDKKDS